ncbi:glycogen debranching protein [Thermosipho melanesiensis]|uniref:Glycogen debranching enzyme GlgX n=2 Tax=Thermosipho melanesiensis TaxID=46541 RepID=A6LKG4_THEM4|nr:glycogen debranching protein GlgX [Thermosipho melanesiensis]ABR30415.1 glycogen debranching enzyme GlgX [Thermosipho melanesiensis BI429]APT73575.1 glycogen debranching protein [Thermosipho melanesiensis]OOC37524.1 glycogen debranching protein [Thermosipho melanesiensis]OOC39420.1 glycogen debranching protein [Thermosipho melanesiensis]OOC39483.1 glycogen debranching protein [Thermosipho melanesiensis]
MADYPLQYDNPDSTVKLKTKRGYPRLGATPDDTGVNFALFSRHAERVILELYQNYYDEKPSHSFELDPILNKTGDIWHIYVYGVKHGQYYGWRVDGPYNPEEGKRFNLNKLLVDPYAKAISSSFDWDSSSVYGYDKNSPLKDLSFSTEDSAKSPTKSIVIDDSKYDWGNDKQLHIPWEDTVIYEMHVRLFTISPTSNVKFRGTFLGIIEKLDHLKELGVTTIELMPVFEFNVNSIDRINPITGKKLKDVWGYNPLGFFAVTGNYSVGLKLGEQVFLFKDFVKELHKNGFEVILDVVYNHTGEGNELGPTLNFRGIDNEIYYMLNPKNKRYYLNYSGCGNTLNCNHPVVKQLIIDSLRYWVTEMHVDGFRFDLAAVLGRTPDGRWIGDFSLLKDISEDPILHNLKLIAEGWDAAGGYFLGEFPQGWAEWNGKYRDIVRKFVRGDEGVIIELAKRITGSEDLYGNRNPQASINFITCHDGFTMRDLVSYNEKHNEENGEDNRDGTNENFSYNHGVEGETDEPKIIKIRKQQVKNFITILMISHGTPMILMGDEIYRTQYGNNNAYCQDNEKTWLDWTLKEKHYDIFRFFKKMIEFRKKHHALRRRHFFTGKDLTGDGIADISWHGIMPFEPDWSYNSHSIAFMISGSDFLCENAKEDNDIFVILNQWIEPLQFTLPILHNKTWYRVVDTSKDSPNDFLDVPEQVGFNYIAQPKSSVVLISQKSYQGSSFPV